MRYFILLLFSIQAICQEKFSDIYYPHIDKAELAITTEDYKQAIQNYESAFAKVKHPLALDLYNAAVCKVFINDFDAAKMLLLKLAIRGVPIEILENESIFKSSVPNWEKFREVYLQIENSFYPNIPDEVSTLLEDIKKYDKTQTSLIYKNEDNGNSTRDRFFTQKVIKDIYEIDDSLKAIKEVLQKKVLLAQKIVEQEGFSEIQIGIKDQKLIYPGLNAEIMNYNLVMSPITHWEYSNNIVYILDTTFGEGFNKEAYLQKGVEQGKWSREIIKYQQNQMDNKSFTIAEVVVEQDCNPIYNGYYIRRQNETLTKVPENEELHLEKAKLLIKGNSHFKLGNIFNINLLTFASCQSAEAELKKWEKLNIR